MYGMHLPLQVGSQSSREHKPSGFTRLEERYIIKATLAAWVCSQFSRGTIDPFVVLPPLAASVGVCKVVEEVAFNKFLSNPPILSLLLESLFLCKRFRCDFLFEKNMPTRMTFYFPQQKVYQITKIACKTSVCTIFKNMIISSNICNP